MKNLVSKLKILPVLLVMGTSALSQQIDKKYFDKTEYLDERPNPEKNLHFNHFQEHNELTTSVSDRAFINHNFFAEISYRDKDNDGKFDGCHTWLWKNDVTNIIEKIELDPKDHSKIEEYILYEENNRFNDYFYKIIKKFENKNISELDLESQSRIKKLMSMEINKESLDNFLEKEFRKKSDWANPNSENTLYNSIKRAYEIPGGLDAIKILRDDELDCKEVFGWEGVKERKSYCEWTGNPNMPLDIQIKAKKNGFPLVIGDYGIEFYCKDRVGKYGFKEKIYSDNTIVRFTEGPGVVEESIDMDEERENIYYKRQYYKIEKNGEVVRLEEHPDNVFVYYKPPSNFSEKDLERIKEIINSAKSESLMRDFIKKEYAKGGF